MFRMISDFFTHKKSKEIKSAEIKTDYFAKLPDAILQYKLFEAIGPQEIARTMVKSTIHHHHLFRAELKKAPFLLIHRFIKHVAYGQQDEAEAMLKELKDVKDEKALNGFLTQKMDVTDISGKKFKNITAFQYALWALDWHMWKMLRNYLPKDKQKSQCDELEEKGVTYAKPVFGDQKEEVITEKHYDFSLIAALADYVDNFETRCWDQRDAAWCNNVGGAQKNVPAHVAQEYCRRDRSFFPTPEFKEATLPRRVDFFDYVLGSNSWFSYDGAVYGADPLARRVSRGWRHVACGHVVADLVAVTALYETRTKQLENLKEELLTQVVAPVSFRR